MDWVQRHVRRCCISSRFSGFQSLLSWIGFKDWRDDLRREVEKRGVSILVVVDWVQRLPRHFVPVVLHSEFQSLLSWIGFKDNFTASSANGFEIGFQSLLSWIGFKDDRGGGCDHQHRQVSILVVVDWVQRRCHGLVMVPVDAKFQSLLSWIGFKDKQKRSEWKRSGCSFNPCCRGLGSETRTSNRLSVRQFMFQSLLSWIGFRD